MSFTQRNLGFFKPPGAVMSKKREQFRPPKLVQYPEDLGPHQFILQFFEYEGLDAATGDARGTVGARSNPQASVAFPIPSNLLEQYKVNYNTSSLGFLAGTVTQNAAAIRDSAIEIAGELADTTQAIGSLNFQDAMSNQTQLGNRVQEMLSAAPLSASDIATVLARRGLSILPGAEGAVDLLTGTTINPHLAVLLDNVPLRTHSFSWKFAPRSAEEGKTLRDILNSMRTYMMPDFGEAGTALLTYPSECDIFLTGTQGGIYLFKRSVLTDLQVNNAPEGVPAFFKGTGQPVVYEISMTLQETEIITKRDFDDTDTPLEQFGILSGPF